MYVILAVLGPRCSHGLSLIAVNAGCSRVAERGLLVAASSVAEHGLLGTV